MSTKIYKSYKPIHTKKEVIYLTESVLNQKIKRIDRKNLGEVNAVYFADLEDGQKCVVRISPKERDYNTFIIEAWAFKKCRETDVPTPEVLAVDVSLSRFPEAYMITKRINGISGEMLHLIKEEEVDLLKQLGHYLSLIHKVKVKGFARYPEVRGEELVGKYPTLWESLKSDFYNPWWEGIIVGQDLIPKEKVNKYKKMLEDNKGLFDLQHASLVHGDIGLKNSIVDKGKITGIVDMENCVLADPIQDFAWYHFWNNEEKSYFSALKDGYDNKDLFEDNFMQKLYLYQLYLGQSLLGYFHTRNNQKGIAYVKSRLTSIEEKLD